MHERLSQNPDYAKRMSRIRSRTVEPVLGTLINFTSLKRVNTQGMALASKHILMASLTYNLKRLLKFSRLKVKINTAEVALKQRKDFLSFLAIL